MIYTVRVKKEGTAIDMSFDSNLKALEVFSSVYEGLLDGEGEGDYSVSILVEARRGNADKC